MIDPPLDPEEFAEVQGNEYQAPHYHDEDPDIVDDETPIRHTQAPADKKKAKRPPPRPRHYED